MADTTLDQWITAAIEGDPSDPIGYARTYAKVAIRDGRPEEARIWKAVIEHLQDEFSKPMPRADYDEGPDDDGSPVF